MKERRGEGEMKKFTEMVGGNKRACDTHAGITQTR